MVDGSGKPALQVIVLGSGGGPNEMNTTAFLIRSVDLQWGKGSVLALDAGVHIGAILKIFDQALPRAVDPGKRQGRASAKTPLFTTGSLIRDGAFSGFECKAQTPGANAAYVMRELIDAYLITHPHLDHISGIITNSPSIPPSSKPKIIAGLPSTIEAIKNHVLNGVIWPNLSNENNGVGFFKYLRLQVEGIHGRSEVPDTGYTHICEGLSISPRLVSHGAEARVGGGGDFLHKDRSQAGSGPLSALEAFLMPWLTWISTPFHRSFTANTSEAKAEVVESTAYFVKDNQTNTEILVFGDIEPDSLSLAPRNKMVWLDAAAKIKAGNLKAIFMECSWDNSVADGDLYGHLSPRFVMEELQVLADFVSSTVTSNANRSEATGLHGESIPLSDISNGLDHQHNSKRRQNDRRPLEGITVVIIHMKEKLDDGPTIQELVKRELLAIEEDLQLGCKFVISEAGMSLEF